MSNQIDMRWVNSKESRQLRGFAREQVRLAVGGGWTKEGKPIRGGLVRSHITMDWQVPPVHREMIEEKLGHEMTPTELFTVKDEFILFFNSF